MDKDFIATFRRLKGQAAEAKKKHYSLICLVRWIGSEELKTG